MEDNIINVNPETGEVEESESKVNAFLNKNIVPCSFVAAILGVIVGTVAALITMKKNDDDEEEENNDGDE